ncbi:unknown protein [Seminavis robusta]|uniref:Uncharacterized protein n=1 Tax=Seminavis robusta TaxID=568900 RepID=A0A9N8EYR8_9STRA|nr:unknown protein [Seminavis robusta]|eukprot:Sro2220_g319600.1 n/a (185) ;mRNA; r:5711-6265
MPFDKGEKNKRGLSPRNGSGSKKQCAEDRKKNHASEQKRQEDRKARDKAAARSPKLTMPLSSGCLKKDEAESQDKIYIPNEWWWIYYLICYQERFNEPAPKEWNEIVKTMANETGGTKAPILRVIELASKDDLSCIERQERPRKQACSGQQRSPCCGVCTEYQNVTKLAAVICNATNNRITGDE